MDYYFFLLFYLDPTLVFLYPPPLLDMTKKGKKAYKSSKIHKYLMYAAFRTQNFIQSIKSFY